MKYLPSITTALWVMLLSPAFAANHSDVFTLVPEAADEGYVVLYELEPPVDGEFRGSKPVPYATDNRASVPDFDRVAYYLELTSETGTQWVYASMDAFAETATAVGLPHNVDNPVAHQQNVRNLNVASNVPGVETGTFLDTGHVEMWPSNYTPSDSYGVFAADAELYDWGDSGGGTGSGYGSFQIHNTMARQTILAYNHWGNDGEIDDIGIGNQPQGQPDWTFAANAADYTSRRLVILVRPRSHELSFTDLPRNRQLYPRNRATNTATVPIAGRESSGGFSDAVLRIFRNDVLIRTITQTLIYTNGTADFSFTPSIAAELAEYDFELRLVQEDSHKTVQWVRNVVVGDVFIFYGQSNAEAMSYDVSDRTANEYATGWLRTFGQNGDSAARAQNILYWMEAEGDGGSDKPASIGQWAMVMGRQIIDAHGIPVAVLNGSRGGYSMARLQKDRANPDNLEDSSAAKRTYNRLRYRAIQGGVADQARAIFFYQGESDKDDADAHAAGFAGLRQDWAVDFPGLEHFYVTQIRAGCIGVSPGDVDLRDVQRRFADTYPNTSVMASNGIPNHDGCHFNFTGGYEELGFHHYRQVARDLYQAPDGPDIDALNPERIEFTDTARDEVELVLRNVGATVDFPAGALADFTIPNSEVTVTGRTINGRTILLQLSGPASEGSRLEYRGHIGEGEWITNANGVGLLTFVEAIHPPAPGPSIALLSPVASREAEVGEIISVEAVANHGPAGPVTRMAFYANGVLQRESEGPKLDTTWQPAAAGAYQLVLRAFDNTGAYLEKSVTVLADPPAAPGGIGDGLQVWLKSGKGIVRGSGNSVIEWRDQSGKDHHARQNVAAAQPELVERLYGLGPGIQFDGDDFLTSTTGMPTGDYTKVVQFTLTSDDPHFLHNILSSAEKGNSSTGREHALYLPLLRPTLFHNVNFVQANRPVTLNQSAVIAGSYNSANRQGKTYFNGELAGTGTGPGDNTKTSFQLGAYLSSYFMHGNVAEVMIYDRVLTDAEQQTMNVYLTEKYLTPYQLWQGQFETEEDGLRSTTEYALGLDPRTHDSTTERLPKITRNGSHIEVAYQRLLNRPDASVRLERSTDLSNWIAVEDQSTGIPDSLETRRYAEELPESATGIFFRLRVTVPGAFAL